MDLEAKASGIRGNNRGVNNVGAGVIETSGGSKKPGVATAAIDARIEASSATKKILGIGFGTRAGVSVGTNAACANTFAVARLLGFN